jgi:hypothetical protein
MKSAVMLVISVIALTVLYFICFAVVSAALFAGTNAPASDQTNGALALLIVSFLNTVVLTYLIRRSRTSGLKLIASVFVVMFGVVTVMPQIETAFFVTRLPPGILPRIFLSGAIVAAAFSVLAVLILKRRKDSATEFDKSIEAAPIVGWAWKASLIIAIYLILYFSFGYFIAWQNAAVRAYYGGTDPHGFFVQMMSTVRDTPSLLALQVARAGLWTILGIVVIRTLKRSWWEAGLMVALLFSVVMNSQLLIPNPYMPEEVRMVHLLETATSNFLFGCLLVWVLSLRSSPAQQLKPA